MEILGFSSITVVLAICIVGIGIRVYIGITKNTDTKFDANAVILSFMVGILVSVGLVAPVIDAIPDDTDDIIILPLIAGQIIIVMKSQSIATAASNIVQKNKEKEKEVDFTEPDPIDDESDLPPGKTPEVIG